jgi:hypothetical protein
MKSLIELWLTENFIVSENEMDKIDGLLSKLLQVDNFDRSVLEKRLHSLKAGYDFFESFFVSLELNTDDKLAISEIATLYKKRIQAIEYHLMSDEQKEQRKETALRFQEKLKYNSPMSIVDKVVKNNEVLKSKGEATKMTTSPIGHHYRKVNNDSIKSSSLSYAREKYLKSKSEILQPTKNIEVEVIDEKTNIKPNTHGKSRRDAKRDKRR